MTDVLSELSIAIAHEHYVERGGSEHVAEHLARLFDAPVYTGLVEESELPTDADIKFVDLFGGGLGDSLLKRSEALRNLYYQFAWQYVPELYEYDVIVQSGNNPGWFVPRDEQVIVKYTHTTPRTAYDLFHKRGDSFPTRLYAYMSRVLYHPNIHYPDQYVANSELVARRLERYWGIDDVEVVYPPVAVDSFGPLETEDFYLSYSRLVENKRFDEIIRAFRRRPDQHLIIGGTGPREAHLKDLASDADNIEFRGYLSESEKRDLLGHAKALVYAAENEDFGMIPIEALASGTPVIGVRDGYTKYQIRDGETGILYDRGVDSLVEAVDRFEDAGVSASPADLVSVAEKYSEDRFRKRMRDIVESTVERVRAFQAADHRASAGGDE